MRRRPAKFRSGRLTGHILTLAGSTSLGMLATAGAELTDLFFIAQLNDAPLSAAMGFAGTLLFLPFAISLGLTTTMSALTAQPLGRGAAGAARRMALSISLFSIGLSTGLAGLLWITAPILLDLLGASTKTTGAALIYMRWVLPATPLMTLAMVWSGLLRAHGDARAAMWVTLVGAATNATLDPILILGFDLGLKGAALATMAGRIVWVGGALLIVWRAHNGVQASSLRHHFSDLKPIRRLALPAMAMNLATPAGHIWVTGAIARFGDAAVAGYAVTARLTPLVFCGIFALSAALTPIIGQNVGAKAFTRVERTLMAASTLTLLYTGLVWVGLILAAAPLAVAFALGPAGQEVLFWFIGAAAPLFAFHGALLISAATFNNLDRPVWSALLNWARNTLGVLPFIWIGAALHGAGGIIIGRAMGGVIFGGLGLWLAFRLVQRAKAETSLTPTVHRLV